VAGRVAAWIRLRIAMWRLAGQAMDQGYRPPAPAVLRELAGRDGGGP
jgi:hypothetical protein